jgi:hypothetical protein
MPERMARSGEPCSTSIPVRCGWNSKCSGQSNGEVVETNARSCACPESARQTERQAQGRRHSERTHSGCAAVPCCWGACSSAPNLRDVRDSRRGISPCLRTTNRRLPGWRASIHRPALAHGVDMGSRAAWREYRAWQLGADSALGTHRDSDVLLFSLRAEECLCSTVMQVPSFPALPTRARSSHLRQSTGWLIGF